MEGKNAKAKRARKAPAKKVDAVPEPVLLGPALNANRYLHSAVMIVALAGLCAYLAAAVPGSVISAGDGGSLRVAAATAQSCTATNLRTSRTCGTTYKNSTVTCQDGSNALKLAGLSATGCYTSTEIRNAALRVCANRCDPRTRRCGIKVSRAGTQCGTTYRHAEWNCSNGEHQVQDATCQDAMAWRATATAVCRALDCTPPAQVTPVTVAKNTAFSDRDATNPTGTVNARQALVSSFVISAGVGEDINLSQIVLRDNNANTCVGTYLQNLTIKDATGKQLALPIANPPEACTTQNALVFNISPITLIGNGTQYVVDVYADLKAPLATPTSLLDVDKVLAIGKTSGNDASAGSQNLALQNVAIAPAGAITVQVDQNSPIANNYLMGATDQTIGKFRVSANNTESATLNQFTVSVRASANSGQGLRNLRLIDDTTGATVGTPIGSLAANIIVGNTTYYQAVFQNLSYPLPAGNWRTISLKADFAPYDETGFETTGQIFVPAILSATTQPAVAATGVSSGAALPVTVSSAFSFNIFPSAPGAHAATTTAYRAKLTMAWAGDAPSGAASPGMAQTVGKFQIQNLANAGNYTATVQTINFNLMTNNIAASSTRALSVYKDSLATSAIASFNFTPGQRFDRTTTIADANFTDVDIAAGDWKTFLVTLDTTEMTSAKVLSIRVPMNGVLWTDGLTTNITAMDNLLPLQYKTFTY